MAETVRRVGYEHSWAGLRIKNGANELLGLRSASWKVTRSRVKVIGSGILPRGKTRGSVEYELSITMLLPDWQKYKKSLGDGYMDVFHDLVILREELGNDEIFKVEFFGCTINSHGGDDSQGEDASEVEIEIDVLEIKDDGDHHAMGDES